MMIWTCGFIRRNGVCRTCVYIYFFSLPSLCSICHYINTLVKWFYFMFVKVLINVPIRFVCSSPHFLYSIFTESINGIGFVFFFSGEELKSILHTFLCGTQLALVNFVVVVQYKMSRAYSREKPFFFDK